MPTRFQAKTQAQAQAISLRPGRPYGQPPQNVTNDLFRASGYTHDHH